ncbi:MAG: hypothetical protein QOD63_2448 [Actinomycetota bacterium]|nr:hypothetical protein [Actinomycetota bacterium]
MQTAQDNDVPPSGVPPAGGPPPGPPPLTRLTRSTQDKVVSGLCGGLGRHFAVDPIVIRVAFVVLALAGGTGILLYLVGWALIPDDQGGVIGGRAGGMAGLRWMGEDRTRKLVAAVVAGVGLLILLNQITDGGDGDVTLGVVLVGLGAAYLWSRRNAGKLPPPGGGGGTWVGPPAPPSAVATDATTRPSPDPSPAVDGDTTTAEPPTGSAVVEIDPTTPPAAPPAGPDPFVATTAPLPAWPPMPTPTPPPTVPPPGMAGWPTVPPPVVVPPRAVRVPKPPKPRSVLVAVTFSVLAIQAGILALAGPSLVTGLALSVLVVGLALVVGTWMGRARWLIPVGLLLSVALGCAVVLDVPIAGGTGNRLYNPATVADLRSPYRLAAGEIILDLGRLDLTGTTSEVDAIVAVGHLVVVVPAGAEVEFDGRVNAGNLVLFGRDWGGTAVRQDVVVPGREGGGRLVLDAQVGVGELEVRRAAA